MQNPVLEDHAVRSTNREIFLLNFREELSAFAETIGRLESISRVVSKARDDKGHTHVSLLPWLMIMNRQFLNSFESISGFRSYDGWALLRPAVEASLIIGKWMDDPEFAHVWENKEENRKAYKKAYEGKALISHSLPNSKNIRYVLSKINDDFMHSNPRYYFRHAQRGISDAQGIQLELRFNDDEAEHKAHLYAFLHFTRFLVQSVGCMFAGKFGVQSQLEARLQKLQEWFKGRVVDFARGNREGVPVLTELGLWPDSLFEFV